MKQLYYILPLCFIAVVSAHVTKAQTHTCPTMVGRNNGNGQANNCPGVNGTPIASSASGTSFQGVPSGAKTADITLKHSNTDAWYTNPPAIYAVYTTNGSTSTAVNTYPGPPGVPSSGNVKYCSYAGSSGNGNMPNAGVITIRFVTPTNISDYLVCSYDFSNGNAHVTTPSSIVTLPVHFYGFDATVVNKSVSLNWTTSRDKNANRFVVERSVNGSDFISIFSTPAADANSQDVANYSYNDYEAGTLSANKLYYRISEIDHDGTITYSNINTVSLTSDAAALSMALQGNMLVIKSGGTYGTLQYIDISGRVLREDKISLNNGVTAMDVQNAQTTGISFIRLIAGSQAIVCRM